MATEAEDEATAEAGLNAIRRDYYRSVTSTVEDFRARLAKGEWSDLEAVVDAVAEETDQTYWSIYYHAAFRCLMASDNEPEAWDVAADMGVELNGRETICVIAAICHRLDIEEIVLPMAEEFFDREDES